MNENLKNKFLILSVIAVDHLNVIFGFNFYARIFYGVGLLATVVLDAKKMIPLFLILFLMSTAVFYFPSFLYGLPSVRFLIPFILMVAIIFLFPSLRSQLGWFQKGLIDKWTWALIFTIGVTSTGALVLWGFWTDNNGAGTVMMKGFLQSPKWIVFALMIPVFALVNAFSEEVVYRGVVQGSLDQIFGETHFLTHLLQASAFAVAHVPAGFPNGKIGYLMVLVYGLMLGYLRVRSKGMLAPYLTHVIADLTIGYFLYWQVNI